jgi:hypothetical protein
MEGEIETRNQGQHLRRIAEEPDGKNRTLHAGRAKAHSALLT